MDFKIDFNIDFSDNEFEKYLANPAKYTEDAKARMRKEAYEIANAKLEATRQKAVAFAKLNSELNAYQQELKVEIDQYMKAETQKLIASVGNSPAPRAESQVPSPPQIESPKIANAQPDNTKATTTSTPKATKEETNKHKTTTSKSTAAAHKNDIDFSSGNLLADVDRDYDKILERNRLRANDRTAAADDKRKIGEKKKKPTIAEKIKEQKDDLKNLMERQARNIMWDAIFAKTNNEYSSDNVYQILQQGKQEGDDVALAHAIQDAIDNGIDYDDLVELAHDQLQNSLDDAYEYQTAQDYFDKIYSEYTAPGAAKQPSYNHPADEYDNSEENQRAMKKFKDMNIDGGF